MKGTGKIHDEQDLRDLYKDKPGRAETIMEKGYHFTDETLGVEMYEDMHYERILSKTN